MLSELEGKTALELSELLRKGEIKVREVVEFFLERIEKYDSKIKSFITVVGERAIEEAEKIQNNLSNFNSRLVGVPIAVKDIIATEGIKTTCGSRILENWIPPYNATAVQKLLDAGLIVIGKTNLDEFAMGSSTENSGFFPTRNPHCPSRVPGGSSGGSGACVSAYLSPLALGTDTGGSIRQPASFCGIVGLNPTYGRVSRWGLVAFASSLDRIGPMCVSVEDTAELLRIIAGFDEKDSTSIPEDVPDYLELLRRWEVEERKLKLGVPKEYFEFSPDERVKEAFYKALRELEKIGFEVEEVSLPSTRFALAVYYIIAPAEASSNLARYDGVKFGVRVEGQELNEMYLKTRKLFGDEVKRRIMVGTYVLSAGYYDAYYLRAQKARTLVKRDFEKAFQQVDVIVCPTTPEVPFKFGEKTDDPVKMYMSDILTVPSSLAGLPAISHPVGYFEEEGEVLPVGFQIIGRYLGEADCLWVARCLELLGFKVQLAKTFLKEE